MKERPDNIDYVCVLFKGFIVGYVSAYIGLSTVFMLWIFYILLNQAQESGIDLSPYFKIAKTNIQYKMRTEVNRISNMVFVKNKDTNTDNDDILNIKKDM